MSKIKKKYLAIITIIAIVIIVGAVIINLLLDFHNENKIKDEVTEIVNILKSEDIDENKINEILNRRVIKKGTYLKVEESIKKYYQDIYTNISNLNFLVDDDNYSNYLKGNNLKEDKPNFIKSKENLNNTKAQIDIEYQAYNKKIADKTTKIVYIADKDLKNYYVDFFLELTEVLNTEEFNTSIDNKVKQATSKNAIYNEIFAFLSANKGHWTLNGDELIFDETTYYEEYTTLVKKLNN